MDDAGMAVGRGKWGKMWTWDSAAKLFRKLLSRIQGDDREKILSDVFGLGRAIGWLMAELLRSDMHLRTRAAHEVDQQEKLFRSEEEQTDAIALLLDRLRSSERSRLVNTPELLSVMYGWKEAGDNDGVVKWVQEQTETDAGFLKLLSACRGWLQTNNQTFYPLNRGDLEPFLNYDDALDRLRRIESVPETPEEEKDLARELLKAAESSRH